LGFPTHSTLTSPSFSALQPSPITDEEEAFSSLEEIGCSSLLADEESSPQATSAMEAANANENAQNKVVILFIVFLLYPTNV
jgi:hypothetical protein